MEIRFNETGKSLVAELDDCRLKFKNFAGAEGMYNNAGERSFQLSLEPEDYEILKEKGFPVKAKQVEDTTYFSMTVKLGWTNRDGSVYGPDIYLDANGKRTKIGPDEAGRLDKLGLTNVNMDVRLFHWTKGAKEGNSCWLNAMEATSRTTNRFAGRIIDPMDVVDEDPFE